MNHTGGDPSTAEVSDTSEVLYMSDTADVWPWDTPSPFSSTRRYEDIMHMNHPAPRGRAPMDRVNRAAQFMPFAALSGYEQLIRTAIDKQIASFQEHYEPDAELDSDNFREVE